MTENKFEVPSWMPTVVADNRPDVGDGVGAALKFGALQPFALLASLVNRLGPVGFGALAVAWSVWGFASGAGRQFWAAVAVCGVVTGRAWYSAREGRPSGERIGFAVLAAATTAVVMWITLLVLVLLAIPAALIAMWISKKNDEAFAAEQREFRVQATSLKPWTVFWAHVANDDGEAGEWAKVRPCIALPPRSTWRDGRPPLDEESAGYPKDWYDDGFSVLTCTSQVKRKDDPMYVEIRPFPNEYTRSFVRLKVSHVVVAPRLQGDKEIQLQLFHERKTPDVVVLARLGPLLNLEDRKRIIEGLGAPLARSGTAGSRPTDGARPSSRLTRVGEDQLQPTLSLLGNPHDLWSSVMPEYHASLSDQEKMDHVDLIFEFARWSIEMHNTDLPFPDLQGQVDRRHFELAVMTGILMRKSKPYQSAVQRHMVKEWASAETLIRYALLVAGPNPSPAGFPVLLRTARAELDIDLFLRHLGSAAARECVKAFED